MYAIVNGPRNEFIQVPYEALKAPWQPPPVSSHAASHTLVKQVPQSTKACKGTDFQSGYSQQKPAAEQGPLRAALHMAWLLRPARVS